LKYSLMNLSCTSGSLGKSFMGPEPATPTTAANREHTWAISDSSPVTLHTHVTTAQAHGTHCGRWSA
jgi:hypothetical protein